MHGRKLMVALTALVSSLALSAGTAWAGHGSVAPQGSAGTGSCTVKSLPSFMAQGEFGNAATVGDVIEVSCDPYTYSAGAEVTVTASQLYSRCHEVTWYKPGETSEENLAVHLSGRSVNLKLDVNGNANVGLIAGPHCMVGESLISVDENSSPYETYTTSFQVLPTSNTPTGLFITPAKQVEDQETSSVITIAQAEFANASEQHVRIGAKQLFSRCQEGNHLELVKMDRTRASGLEGGELLNAIELDNNSNGFVLLIGASSCAEGRSLIEADLESSPFTTLTANFTIEAPRVRPNGE